LPEAPPGLSSPGGFFGESFQTVFNAHLEEKIMWKIIVGFIVFAALAMFVIIKGGDKLDMSGEKHDGGDAHSTASAPAAAAPAASAASGASAAK
jgi:hypothetical protein